MFHSLNGIITGRGPNALHLTTGGVEWELEVSGFTLRQLAHAEEARIFTYLHHREDQMRLYGFFSADERRVFLELTRVSGIGPRPNDPFSRWNATAHPWLWKDDPPW